MRNLLTILIKNPLASKLVNYAVIVAGIASLFLIRRDVFPSISYDTITVTTIFPGASAEEVETLVTNGLEQRLRETNGIKKMVSHSLESRSTITVQIDPAATTQDKAMAEVRSAVDRYLPSLPEGCQKPLVNAEDSTQTPVIEAHLVGGEPLQVHAAAKKLKRELELTSGVSRVNLLGLPELELRVQTSGAKLSSHQVTILEVANALKKRNVSVPGGVVEEAKEKTVRVSGKLMSADDVRRTVIRANEAGVALTVGDIATVTESLERPTLIHRTGGKRSVALVVQKRSFADAVSLVVSVRQRIEELKPTLGKIEVEYANDMSLFITRRLSLLTSNFTYGLLLLVGMLALFLPWRLAALISMGLPFAIFGTVILLYFGNYSLNLVSLIGLIIIAGMLIDDAIVMSDSCLRYLRNGSPPAEAAIEGTSVVWKSVAASSIATILTFVPIVFMGGQSGKLARELPLGIIFALLLSLFKTFFILPVDFVSWIRPKDASARTRLIDRIWTRWVTPFYLGALKVSLRNRYKVCFGGMLLFAVTVYFGMHRMPFVLFPSDDMEVFVIAAETAPGTSLEATENRLKPVEAAVAKLSKEELKQFVTQVGFQTNDGSLQSRYGSELAEMTVYLTPPDQRKRSNDEIIEGLRAELGKPAGLQDLRFIRVNPGLSVGKPIQLAVRADEYAQALPAVEELKASLRKMPGVTGVTDSYLPGKKNVSLQVDALAAARAGVSVEDIGSTVRAVYSGIVPTKLWLKGEESSVRVVLSKEDRATSGTLSQLRVLNSSGTLVPLTKLGTVHEKVMLSDFEHENGRRQVVVSADSHDVFGVTEGLKPVFQTLSQRYPGVSLALGGEVAAAEESMGSLLLTLGLALLSIFLILILTFQKLSHALLTFISIPLGITAATWAFAAHGKPYTFMGLMGIIALCGVIVNNAIVFLDFVNHFREQGYGRWRSILCTGKLRLRPIFLTTATTVAGVLPTAYGIGGADSFVTYIALALSWGLGLGTLLTLFVLPAAVSIVDSVESFNWTSFRIPRGWYREKSVATYSRV